MNPLSDLSAPAEDREDALGDPSFDEPDARCAGAELAEAEPDQRRQLVPGVRRLRGKLA
jgi:hypothetical protein